MRIFRFVIILIGLSLNFNSYSQSTGDGYGFIDLDTVSVVGYYDNYTANYYLYSKKSETIDQSGRKVIDCRASTFNFSFNFQVVKNRHTQGGAGLLPNSADNLSNILIYPGTLFLESLDNKTTPNIDKENLATNGGLVKANGTAKVNVNFINIPNPGYNELALLSWGEDPYRYNIKASFDIFEFATDNIKTLHFFDQPYNIIGCDRDCYPFYCSVDGLYLGPYMTTNISDIVPDRINAYRDETGGQNGLTTIRITYKKIDDIVYNSFERIIEDWIRNPKNSKIQQVRNLIAASFNNISGLFCQGDNATNGTCLTLKTNPLCESEEHPNIVDYIFCGAKNPIMLPVYQMSAFLSSITNVTADYLTNPDMSLPLKLLQLMSIGWPVFGFKLDYIKVVYEPEKNAPILPPLIYKLSEEYGRTYAYVRSPDLFEWISNDPVETIIDLKVIDGETIEEYFKNYHLKSFNYNIKIILYLSGDYPSKAKMERNGKLYIDLDN